MSYIGKKNGNPNTDFLEAGGELENHDLINVDSSGNVNLDDNKKAQFGASNDLQIYHDGTDSVIKDTGTGNLVLTSNGGGIFLRNNEETETYANFNNNGAVELRYDNSQKFITTSTGINVTGAITVNGSALSSGLSEVDMWELTSSLSCTGLTNNIPTGWSRVNHDGFEKIGTGLSHSSGVFTFPSTGYYSIIFHASYERNGNNLDYLVSVIQTTTNGSTYSDASANYTQINATPTYQAVVVPFVFKVTSTSTHKFKIKVFPEALVTLQGDTGVAFSSVTTMKLGDV